MTVESILGARRERTEDADLWQLGFYVKQELFHKVLLLRIVMSIREVGKFPSPFPGVLEIIQEKKCLSVKLAS